MQVVCWSPAKTAALRSGVTSRYMPRLLSTQSPPMSLKNVFCCLTWQLVNVCQRCRIDAAAFNNKHSSTNLQLRCVCVMMLKSINDNFSAILMSHLRTLQNNVWHHKISLLWKLPVIFIFTILYYFTYYKI